MKIFYAACECTTATIEHHEEQDAELSAHSNFYQSRLSAPNLLFKTKVDAFALSTLGQWSRES